MFIFAFSQACNLRNLLCITTCLFLASAAYAVFDKNLPAGPHEHFRNVPVLLSSDQNFFNKWQLIKQKVYDVLVTSDTARTAIYSPYSLSQQQQTQLTMVRLLRHPVASKVLPSCASVAVTALSSLDITGNNTSVKVYMRELAGVAGHCVSNVIGGFFSSKTLQVMMIVTGEITVFSGVFVLAYLLQARCAHRLEANLMKSLRKEIIP